MGKKADILLTNTDALYLPKYTQEIYATDNGEYLYELKINKFAVAGTIYFFDDGNLFITICNRY